MEKKYNSEKRNPNRKVDTGKEIINKLDNLYQKSMHKVKYPSQIDMNDILNKQFPYLKKKLAKPVSALNPNHKSFLKYASINSANLKSPLKENLSNDPPTIDNTGKYNSPSRTLAKSNLFDSTTRYQLKGDLQVVNERINSGKVTKYKLKYDIKSNNINNDNKEDDNNYYNDLSLNSKITENKEHNPSTNEDYNQEKKNENDNNVNIINNISNKRGLNSSLSESSFSYKGDKQKFPYLEKDYYSSMLDNYKNKKREKLLQSSTEFYLQQLKFMSKSSHLKKREYNFDYSKKNAKLFSELKRVPTVIAFGKVVPSASLQVQKNNKKQIFIRPKKTLGHNKNTKQIFKKGLINRYSINKLKEEKLIKDDYNTNNPNKEDYMPKDQFGNIVYPIFGQKKMLKNMMPKEYDYNTIRSPLELLHDTYHPLLRFQKKMLAQHINAINQEIGVTYSKYFTLVDKSQIPEKFRCAQDLIDLQKDEKLIKLIRELIDRNFGLEKEVTKTLDLQKKEKENLRKKQIYRKFSEVMLKASIHFKRLNISLEDFYSIPDYIPKKSTGEAAGEGESDQKIEDKVDISKQKQLIMQKNGQHFFEAIKAGDASEIIRIMNLNYFIMFYRDHFLQSPLHISAKRNLYKFISLFISRGADINAQDEGGRTALLIAAEKNNLEFVTVLLFEIADPSIKNALGQKPIDVTSNLKIKLILERAKILHYFHKIGKIQQFNESIRNGLSFLYKEEMGINYDVWLKENKDVIKECEQ